MPEENVKRFQQLLNLPPTVQTQGKVLTRLDREMSEISNSNAYSDERENWAKYQDVLERYLRKKLPDPVRKDVSVEAEHKKDIEQREKQDRVEAVLRDVKKTFRDRAKQLLEFIDKSSNIKWTKEGRVVIDGVELPHSNISALVNCATSTRSRTKLPNGTAQFSLALQKASVPSKFIGNTGFFETPLSAHNSQILSSSETSPKTANTSKFSTSSPKEDVGLAQSVYQGLTKWAPWPNV